MIDRKKRFEEIAEKHGAEVKEIKSAWTTWMEANAEKLFDVFDKTLSVAETGEWGNDTRTVEFVDPERNDNGGNADDSLVVDRASVPAWVMRLCDYRVGLISDLCDSIENQHTNRRGGDIYPGEMAAAKHKVEHEIELWKSVRGSGSRGNHAMNVAHGVVIGSLMRIVSMMSEGCANVQELKCAGIAWDCD